jgi:hypothetical protein
MYATFFQYILKCVKEVTSILNSGIAGYKIELYIVINCDC